MKNLLIIIFILGLVNGYSQNDVRATCKSSDLKVQAYVQAFEAPVSWVFPTGNQINLILVFSLPANGETNPLNAPVPVTASTPLNLPLLNYPISVVNDRFIYTYYIVSSSLPGPITWDANTEHLVMEITFGSNATGIFPRLDNLLNSTPTGFDYFYLEVNGDYRSDTEGDPFYSGTEGMYGSGDLWVQAATPLPIKLLSFSAEKNGERSSLLSWSTASESNSSYFGVERSNDKINWKTAGKVKAAGNSQIVLNYNLLDKDVYLGTTSDLTVYYRLKMVDIDDSFQYSPIESVHFGTGKDPIANTNEFLVYPNPASEGIHVEWKSDQPDQPTAFEFYDISGKLIYTQKVSAQTNEQYVDFTKTNIQTGLCMMRVMSGDKSIDHKQIVVGQNH